jgi:hypothetical protein
MPLHQLPARFDLTATTGDAVDVERGQAIVAGDTYELDVLVEDANGDPFLNGSTHWTAGAALRDGWVFDGGAVQATATVVWTSASGLRLSLTAAQTGALAVDGGVWDLQLVNVSDPGYVVGYVQTVLRGSWLLLKDATR